MNDPNLAEKGAVCGKHIFPKQEHFFGSFYSGSYYHMSSMTGNV